MGDSARCSRDIRYGTCIQSLIFLLLIEFAPVISRKGDRYRSEVIIVECRSPSMRLRWFRIMAESTLRYN